MPPGKPSKNPRDKQDLDYLVAVLACTGFPTTHNWASVQRMTTAMGYNWSVKTVSNYWSERIAKHIDVGLKAVNGTNGNSPGQEGGPAAANILTNPVKKRASRAAGRAANTAKKRVRPVNPVARQVASPKKIRKIRYCSGNDYKLALKKIKSEIDDEKDIEMPKVEYEKNIKLEPLVKREDDSE